jgi:hypothetical protein
MKSRALAIALAAGIALPQTALACYHLSENVWMCAGQSVWQAAEWDIYGDGSTLVVDDYVLNFTEDFPGAEIKDDLSTLAEQFVTYAELAAADGTAPLEINTQDLLDIPAGSAFRSLQRDRYDGVETVSAVMLVEVSKARIMLYLDGPQKLDWDTVDVASRGVLDLIRDSCADAATCASANKSLETTE